MVNQAEILDRTFSALGDPTRRAIVERLTRGDASITELSTPFDMSMPAVLKHVAVLEAAGLVRCEKAGRVRRCRLEPKVLDDAERWVQRRLREWKHRMDRLGEVVER